MEHPNRRAVIDCGTNTFHLLIADIVDGGLQEVYRERRFVKLATDGIEKIGPAPFARGLDALTHYADVLREHNCLQVTAFGTAALRSASNGPEFVEVAAKKTGVQITLIPGDEEARLITKGVLAALPAIPERVLIMDIGGGSTEFILAQGNDVYWRRSFPIGVSVLKNEFHKNDPITYEEIVALQDHLQQVTKPLVAVLSQRNTQHLVGAAGTFDVLANVLRDESAQKHPTSQRLQLAGLAELHQTVIHSTMEERLAFPGLPPERADMIVVAMVLIDFVIQLAGVNKITVSDYAMKEGILLEQAAGG